DPNDEPDVSEATGASDVSLATALQGVAAAGLTGFLPDYNSRAADPDWGYGYGWSVSALPTVFPSQMVSGVCVAFNTTDTLSFSGSGTRFSSLFGGTAKMRDDGTYFYMTASDGTVYTFYDLSQSNPGKLVSVIAPGGAGMIVSYGTDTTTIDEYASA